jgi:hypothetical protein
MLIVGFHPARFGWFETLKLLLMFSSSMQNIARVMFTYTLIDLCSLKLAIDALHDRVHGKIWVSRYLARIGQSKERSGICSSKTGIHGP